MDYIEENDNQLENAEEVNTDSVEPETEETVEISSDISDEPVQDFSEEIVEVEQTLPFGEDIEEVEEKEIPSSYAPPHREEAPKKKNSNVVLGVIALILIVGVLIFGAVKIFSPGGGRAANTIATVDAEIYEIGMKAVDFIDGRKLLTADLVGAEGDLQAALGMDYIVISNFNTAYATAMDSFDGTTASDTHYFVEMIGVALSAQVQQLAIEAIVADVQASPDAWSSIDTSKLPDVATAYENIWMNITKLIKSGDMEKVRSYYDGTEWTKELLPLEEYLMYFDSQLYGGEEGTNEDLGLE